MHSLSPGSWFITTHADLLVHHDTITGSQTWCSGGRAQRPVAGLPMPSCPHEVMAAQQPLLDFSDFKEGRAKVQLDH